MFEKIRDLIVEEVGVDADQVTMEASFKNDLNIDSLDLFEMVMALEEEFDVEIEKVNEELTSPEVSSDFEKVLELTDKLNILVLKQEELMKEWEEWNDQLTKLSLD